MYGSLLLPVQNVKNEKQTLMRFFSCQYLVQTLGLKSQINEIKSQNLFFTDL